MAYKKEELLSKAISVTKEKNLFFIEDIVAFLPCSKRTFYEHKLHESQELKEVLENNKITVKTSLRKKWRESDNATLQMALYKLIASTNERKCLSVNYLDHEHHGEIQIKVEYEDDKDKDQAAS